MINMKLLRKCEGELEHAIKCRCVETCSKEDYINSMEGIITRTRIGKTWTRSPMDSKMVPKNSREDERPERPPFRQEFPLLRSGRQHHDNKPVTNVMGSIPVGDKRRSQSNNQKSLGFRLHWRTRPFRQEFPLLRSGRQHRDTVLKCHKCGSTSNLANNCTKKTKINEVQAIGEAQCA
ncbi:hypothetical protein O181_061832 [Austropuccinia psidii MF-1]|uniref:Uncharacterized protein n=1 Tax=Austropuccinia psidii MF-1 TaxID=1389203 RepID=A0A9Q3HZT3_9BASI|nr:hypothetical protein [Austropuccinia psidii MF-1]